MVFIRFAFLCLFLSHPLTSLADINNYFSQIKNDRQALYAFLKNMPKGGELHYHLAGGAYPETMLALAAKGNYCLDKTTWMISKSTSHCAGIHSAALSKQPSLYEKAIRAWSMKDFSAAHETGHDHFFASFYKFMPVVFDHRAQLLAKIMQRAARQHEHYMEIMMLPDNAQASNFALENFAAADFLSMEKKLLANPKFQQNIHHTVAETKNVLYKTRKILACHQKPEQAVCQITVKFQYYILREQPVEKVFAQALNGFAAAAQSSEIVGVNLVQAEDGIIALRDYRQQMQIFSFLHQRYPHVHIALHAGELAPEMPANDLSFHINEAIETGKAERIGHGIDILHEKNSIAILKKMAKQKIAIEINLTSNKKILQVSSKQHPLPYYLAHQVPVVLSTDDEGILRTSLTRQYLNAAAHYALDYPTLKTINRNTLTYSFLPGQSLWADPAKGQPVQACQALNSPSCLDFIKRSEKAKLQWQLETKLAAFENKYKTA